MKLGAFCTSLFRQPHHHRLFFITRIFARSIDDEIEEIQQRVKEYKRILRRHAVSSYKSRSIGSSIASLELTMADAEKKRQLASPANTIANIPSHVSIEVLSNGTTHLPPCVAIRTPLKVYLFNCPEGTSRFLPALRLKPQAIHDIFITRGVWDNIGGISSILLSKETSALPMRIHGAVNVKNFLECIRPFQDSDFGSVKYPSQVDECTFATHDKYEDAAMIVRYIPVVPSCSNGNGTSERKSQMDMAYLVELKEPARRIDPRKLLALQVPKGPLIGKLKAGEVVDLPDGRQIRPDDVYADRSSSSTDRACALVVDCETEQHLGALLDNSLIKSVTGRVDYVVHFSPDTVLALPAYQEWIEQLGQKCTNIVVNGNGPIVPSIDSIYRHARNLHRFQPALFDELRPKGWRGIVTQERDLGVVDGGLLRAAVLQRFWMRMAGGDEPILLDLKEDGEEWINEEAKQALDKANQLASSIASSSSSPFPRIAFLGTSSAVPSKYRNVSSYLVETSDTSAFLVDVGEGTYGQLRTLLDDDQCQKMLTNLHCVFITHAHQDHMNGLYAVIEKRKMAFEAAGLPYRPLVLVCNKNVVKPLRAYSMCFENVEQYVHIVDLATTHPVGTYRKTHGRVSPPPDNAETLSATSDIAAKMPKDLFDKASWCLDGIMAVQVHHTRMANAFVFTTNGKKVVFSGDTKPCDLLVEEGKGADLLIHEATFEDGHEVDAMRKKHSTMGQAVDIGKRMNAKHIILTHFSARYPKVPPLPKYLDEAGNIGIAMDNMRVAFPHIPLVPLLIPVYRMVYQDELFEIDIRKEQRTLREKEGGKEQKGRKWKNKGDNGNEVIEASHPKKAREVL